jgi:hypothetical protein
LFLDTVPGVVVNDPLVFGIIKLALILHAACVNVSRAE